MYMHDANSEQACLSDSSLFTGVCFRLLIITVSVYFYFHG